MGDPGAFNSYYPTFLRYIGTAVVLAVIMYVVYRVLRAVGVKHEAATGFTLILPWIIGFLAFVVVPIGISFYLSFTEYNILWDKPKSLDDPLYNYKRALSLKIITMDPDERIGVAALGKLESNTPEPTRYRELTHFVDRRQKICPRRNRHLFL